MSATQNSLGIVPGTPVEVQVPAGDPANIATARQAEKQAARLAVVATERSITEDDLAGSAPSRPGEPCPLFFGAARRSGTTWLAGMLNAHPQIECRNEGWMFNDFGASFPEWLDEDKVRAWGARREAQGTWLRHQTIDEAVRSMRRGMWLSLTREGVRREGWKKWESLRYVGDKTTTHFCTQVREVARTFPEARFLHMLRDGRDVVVSDMFLLFRELETRDLPADARREALAARSHHVFGKGPRVPLLGPASMRYLVSEWATAVSGGRLARELLGSGQWHEVRYEAIATRPVEELGAVLGWLGVDCEPRYVQHLVDTHTFEQLSGGRSRGQEDVTAEWRKGVSGDWKNHFTDENRAMFKSIAGELLIELGYEQGMDW